MCHRRTTFGKPSAQRDNMETTRHGIRENQEWTAEGEFWRVTGSLLFGSHNFVMALTSQASSEWRIPGLDGSGFGREDPDCPSQKILGLKDQVPVVFGWPWPCPCCRWVYEMVSGHNGVHIATSFNLANLWSLLYISISSDIDISNIEIHTSAENCR